MQVMDTANRSPHASLARAPHAVWDFVIVGAGMAGLTAAYAQPAKEEQDENQTEDGE